MGQANELVELAATVLDMNPRNTIGQQVVMGLEVPRGRANVHPICSLRNVRKEWLAFLQQLRKEIDLYDPTLSTRPWFVLANKMDLPDAAQNLKDLKILG